MENKPQRSWALIFFGLPFASVAFGMLAFAIIPSFLESFDMKKWQPVQATVLQAELNTHYGDDSTTYSVSAEYRYQFQGRTFIGQRVGISESSDNVGDWHQKKATHLKWAKNNHRTITVYVNPQNPAESIVDRKPRYLKLAFYGLFVVVFGIAGVGIMVWGWRQQKTNTGVNNPEKPWLSQVAWASPDISAHQATGVWMLWGIAFIWCALSAPATFAIPSEIKKGNWAILVILLFDFVGIGLVLAAIKQTISAKKFGDTVLKMDPWPGSVNGQTGGMIETRVPFDAALAFNVKLSCIRSYTSGSGKNRSTHHDTLWQDERWFHGEPAENNLTNLWFCFDVPNNLPVSETPSSDYKHWQLQVSADIPGVDFERSWELPVFSTEQVSQKASRRVKESKEELLEAIEELMNLTPIPGGVALDFKAGRHWLGGLMLTLIGLIFTGAAVFIGRSLNGVNEMVITGAFAIIGPLLLLLGLWQLGHRLQVHINHEQVLIRYSVLGVSVYKKDVALLDVEAIEIKRGSRMQVGGDVTQYYHLMLKTKTGKQYTIGDGFEGYSQAEMAAKQVARITRLNFHES